MENKKLLIIGCGGHSKVATDIAELSGYDNIQFLETNESTKDSFMGRKVNKYVENWKDNFFVAIGDNSLRQDIFRSFANDNKFATAVSLFHPTSCISKYAEIMPGSLFLPFTVVNAFVKIGYGVIVNTSSVVEHDNILNEFCSLAPGVKTGGNVEVGCRAAISLGCSIAPGIKIGEDNIIGANSFVKYDTRDNSIYYGIPARFIRIRKNS